MRFWLISILLLMAISAPSVVIAASISCTDGTTLVEKKNESFCEKRDKRTGKSIKHGPYISYYKNGKVASQGSYQNGQRADLWIDYYDTGKKKAERHIDLPNIKITTWFVNGKKLEEGQLVRWEKSGDKGIAKNGKWSYWYENGQKESTGNYKYFPEKEGHWKVGSWIYWCEKGKKLEEIDYGTSGVESIDEMIRLRKLKKDRCLE